MIHQVRLIFVFGNDLIGPRHFLWPRKYHKCSPVSRLLRDWLPAVIDPARWLLYPIYPLHSCPNILTYCHIDPFIDFEHMWHGLQGIQFRFFLSWIQFFIVVCGVILVTSLQRFSLSTAAPRGCIWMMRRWKLITSYGYLISLRVISFCFVRASLIYMRSHG